jgi:hypothetical protein
VHIGSTQAGQKYRYKYVSAARPLKKIPFPRFSSFSASESTVHIEKRSVLLSWICSVLLPSTFAQYFCPVLLSSTFVLGSVAKYLYKSPSALLAAKKKPDLLCSTPNRGVQREQWIKGHPFRPRSCLELKRKTSVLSCFFLESFVPFCWASHAGEIPRNPLTNYLACRSSSGCDSLGVQETYCRFRLRQAPGVAFARSCVSRADSIPSPKWFVRSESGWRKADTMFKLGQVSRHQVNNCRTHTLSSYHVANGANIQPPHDAKYMRVGS